MIRTSRAALLLLLLLPFFSHGQVRIGNDTAVCSSQAPYFLFAQPAGGTWSGSPLVTANGFFSPVRGTAPFRVTYTIGAANASKLITTIDAPIANAGKDTSVCDQQVLANGVGTPGVPGLHYKWFRIVNNQQTHADGLDNDTLANPTVTLANANGPRYDVLYQLTVTNRGNGCVATDIVYVAVFPSSNVVPVIGPDFRICADAAPAVLTASPEGGFWSGTGITQPNIFTPSPLLEGTHTLSYYIPCTPSAINPVTRNVTVLLPKPNAGIDTTICANANPLYRRGSPGGGTWSGRGIAADGLFTPIRALLNGAPTQLDTLVYTVGINGCLGKDTVIITLVDYPTIIVGGPLTICGNAKPVVIDGGFPRGGQWSGLDTLSRHVAGGVISVDSSVIGVGAIRYTVTANGCSNYADRTVIVNNYPRHVYAGRDTTVCSNEPPFLLQGARPSGGVWSGTGPIGSISGSGVYRPSNAATGFQQLIYTVTDPTTNCFAKDSLQIEVLPVPQNVNAGHDTTVCANNPPFNLVRGTTAGARFYGRGVDSLTGTYTPTTRLVGTQTIYYIIPTPRGCKAKDTLLVRVLDLPRANAGIGFNVCSGSEALQIGDAPLDTAPGLRYKYKWTGSDGTFGFNKDTISNPIVRFTNNGDSVLPRSYYIKVTRKQVGLPSCSNSDTIKIKIFPRPRARTIAPLRFRACQGDTVLLRAEAQPRIAYQWINGQSLLNQFPSPANSTYKAIVSGRYRVIAIDTIRVRGSLCADTSTGDSVYIKPKAHPVITGFPGYCPGRTDTLVVRPADPANYAYQWLKHGRNIIGAIDTVYYAAVNDSFSVVVTDSRFGITCIDTSPAIKVDSIPVPYNNLVPGKGTDTLAWVCSKVVPFTLLAPIDSAFPDAFKYRWQDGSTARFHSVDTTGLYILTVYNRCGSVTDTFNLAYIYKTPEFHLLNLNNRHDTAVCKDLPYRIKGPDGVAYYLWQDSTNKAYYDFNTNDTIDYTPITLTVRSVEGCLYTDSISVKVKLCQPQVYAASAFTPQGDNVNDTWELKMYSVSKVKVYIYDRWGIQVYYAGTIEDARNKPWDGTYKGERCASGMYQYLIQYEGQNPDGSDNEITKKITGSLAIIR